MCNTKEIKRNGTFQIWNHQTLVLHMLFMISLNSLITKGPILETCRRVA